jgi:hypothetical protein
MQRAKINFTAVQFGNAQDPIVKNDWIFDDARAASMDPVKDLGQERVTG